MITYLIIIAVFFGLLMLIKTGISRAAKAAFEREIVEEEEFILVKPEGFLTPVDRFFEAYSKEFVEGGKKRKSWAKMSIIDSFEKDSQKSFEKTEDEIEIIVFEKLLGNKKHHKTYKLEVFVVKEAKNEYFERVNEMLNSFKLKEI